MRQSLSLSGNWQFQLDPNGELSPETLSPDREITVPLPWQAAFPELARYSGYAWYKRSFDLREEWLKGDLLLRFGAVDYWCRVFLNGQQVGEHEGGYTSFEMSLKDRARPGPNEIAVQVYDSAQEGLPVARWPEQERPEDRPGPPFNAQDIPHGKQEWYINAGGIWQDVELVALPPNYIRQLHISTDIRSGQADITVQLAGDKGASGDGTLQIEISAEGRKVGTSEVRVLGGQENIHVPVRVESHRLWSLEDPYLYAVTATLQTAAGEDQLSTRFGFREIATEDGRILLNGEPLFLLCALDQDLYPDTIYTVPSEEFLRDQFEKAKQLGLNCLRCHIKPPDPRYLDLADEMGLLVWAEIPSWRTFHNKPTLFSHLVPITDAIKRRVEQTLEEMVRRDFNHPSLIIWTIVNEDWGTSLPLCSEDREWVAGMYERCKQLDPTRLVVDNSACPHPWGPNIHVRTDLDDFHMYANIPDRAQAFAQSIEQFALRPLWTFSNHGDASRTGKEPLVLSEFGNWGLPSNKALRDHYGGDPQWFEIGAWWSPWEGEAGWAKGVEDRYTALGLNEIWGDYEQFAAATQWHQFHAMKFEIEAMRRQPTLAGYVITEFTDAYWESNGLLDFARNPKVYHDRFARINSPDMIVPQVRRYSCWDDRPLPVELFVARYGTREWEGATLRWEIEGTGMNGERPLPVLERGVVRRLGTELFKMPEVEQTRTVRITFYVTAQGGQQLASNDLEILVMPAASRKPRYERPVVVITSDVEAAEETGDLPARPPESISGAEETPLEAGQGSEVARQGSSHAPVLGHLMRHYGYTVERRLNPDTQLAVTNYPTAELLQWVRDGGNLIFISDGPSPFFWSQNRSGAYSGSWITSFSWLRDGVHPRLKVENPLGLPFMHMMPTFTILGLPVEDRGVQSDFLSGMVSGWVHHPAVHTLQFRYGQGRVIMTTFSLEKALQKGDPVALAMLHDLIEYLCSERCRPTLSANF